MNFLSLANTIRQTHDVFYSESVKAINKNLTLRNWLIGYYIVEYEQGGEDRAAYGTRLLASLADKVAIKGISETSLKLCRQLYAVYPQIGTFITSSLSSNIFPFTIRQSLTDELSTDQQGIHLAVPVQKLITHLSFTHLTELLPIEDVLKRTFYEVECIKGSWSVRELKRQISSLYYDRTGLSKDPQKMAAYVQNKLLPAHPKELLKDHHIFEFLSITDKTIIEETDLEQALLNHLQEFILELGNGFCFEARQKRIVIGEEYFFVDIVFYHRILKCHVLIELKVEPFNHLNVGQLNMYLNYFKKEVMQPDDNPPVGILLVTDKNNAMVEYATTGIDNKLFVSKYQLQLPTKNQLSEFVKNELQKM